MYSAVIKMVKSNEMDEFLTASEKILWKSYINEFSVREDGGLLWKGLKIPTLEQIDQVLQPVHYSRKMFERNRNFERCSVIVASLCRHIQAGLKESVLSKYDCEICKCYECNKIKGIV